ncbi:UNVERIFIED_CONTAM: hypothetical protein Sradi_1409400 [Sesamum radiatum]|uniref:Uncharacterized protein n=1 Tax=Sesamum radiatum TaxID=300843 RepID=A0AAW2USC8_SESRA
MAETFPVKPKLRPTSGKSTPTAESKYWKSFKIPKDIETTPSKSLNYPITSLSFSPVAPHDFAATHSASFTVFSGKTLEPKFTVKDFSDAAASASFLRWETLGGWGFNWYCPRVRCKVSQPSPAFKGSLGRSARCLLPTRR